MKLEQIKKRNGRIVKYRRGKIIHAIAAAFDEPDMKEVKFLTTQVEAYLEEIERTKIPEVEQIQDAIEQVLILNGKTEAAKKFILYREERTRAREMNNRLMKIYSDFTFKDASEVDLKRENANINGDTSMGTMLRYGSEGAKHFNQLFVLKPEHARAHRNGDIHIHDLDFLSLTTTCCQIDLKKLFNGGFSTGHGHLREPNNILTYSALAAIAIQSNQNDQHGGQSIPMFDYGMTDGVKKTYRQKYAENLEKIMRIEGDPLPAKTILKQIREETGLYPVISGGEEYYREEERRLNLNGPDLKHFREKIRPLAEEYALEETEKETYQAMEAFVHNLNTMHSRAGAQVPFSSINYGTDTSPEGRMVIKNILLAMEAGLGKGETPIFPINIFKVKEGVNYNEGDPNYDLFKLACKVSAKRLFPNFAFLDAPYNLKYYKEGNPDTECVYMGCRTRVIGNAYDPKREVVSGRGNLSFTTINLPRIAMEAAKTEKTMETFYTLLDEKLDLVISQLYERYRIQAAKKVKNYPFLMGQGVWLDSEHLDSEDTVGEVLKHGTLSCGFIGLAECLKMLTGNHHGETEESQKLGLEIIAYMRERMDRETEKTKMNYSLLATPAEGLCLAGDTPVHTVNGIVNISDIKPGDRLITVNEETNEFEIDTVLECGQTGNRSDIFEITFNTGTKVVCTSNHPFAVRRIKENHEGSRYRAPKTKNNRLETPWITTESVWLAAEKLEPGMFVNYGCRTAETLPVSEICRHYTCQKLPVALELKGVYVTKVEKKNTEIPVYDITMNRNHNFLAGDNIGILVHNSGRFVKIDREKYGKIEGVTDRDYYTNSFHVPVYYNISAMEKIRREAPYHELTNAGHISYVELDGDPVKNLEAFEQVVRAMKENGIGYGSINHPVDRDPVCGYTGIIDNVCPQCGRRENDHIKGTERIRRKQFPEKESTNICSVTGGEHE